MVLKLLQSLVFRKPVLDSELHQTAPEPRSTVAVEGVVDFNVEDNLIVTNGLPILNWATASQWVESISSADLQQRAWSECEIAWLDHLRVALGPSYRLRKQGQVLLLSSLEANVADAAITFISKSLRRIVNILGDVAKVSDQGHEILIAFDDSESYYRYAAHYYPDAGEFALSGGMYINLGCGHFITVNSNLYAVEPVIVHELTHSLVSHLPLPAWLNEGIAVNTERRLCPPPSENFTPRQMHERHCIFWGVSEIQEFWSGKSFLRTDEGNELSYDLARILVTQLGSEWSQFQLFVTSAHVGDAGASAAHSQMGLNLGKVVSALLEKEYSPMWEPNATVWSGTPELGAF
jgi:hypothetical protein